MCNESPRFLAKQDRWEEARAVLSKVRHLPSDHAYIEAEFGEMVTAIENERMLIGGSGFKDLMREMWTIPGNRKRALISIGLMVCQQVRVPLNLNREDHIFPDSGYIETSSFNKMNR